MNIDQIKAGETYTYYPPDQKREDNIHWPAKVLQVGKRVRVQLQTPSGNHIRSIGAQSLQPQAELL